MLLHALTSVGNSTTSVGVSFEADGAGSELDISSVAAFYGTTNYTESRLQVTNGATLLDRG